MVLPPRDGRLVALCSFAESLPLPRRCYRRRNWAFPFSLVPVQHRSRLLDLSLSFVCARCSFPCLLARAFVRCGCFPVEVEVKCTTWQFARGKGWLPFILFFLFNNKYFCHMSDLLATARDWRTLESRRTRLIVQAKLVRQGR